MITIGQTITDTMHALQYLLEGPRKDGLPGPRTLYYGFCGWDEEIVRSACLPLLEKDCTAVIGVFDPTRPEAGLAHAGVTVRCGEAIAIRFGRLWQAHDATRALLVAEGENGVAGHYRIDAGGVVHHATRPARDLAPGMGRAERNLARRTAACSGNRMVGVVY